MCLPKKFKMRVSLFLFLISHGLLAAPLIAVNKGRCESFYSSDNSLPLGWQLQTHDLSHLDVRQRQSFLLLGKQWTTEEMNHIHLPTPIARVVSLDQISEIRNQENTIPHAVEGIGLPYNLTRKTNDNIYGVNTQDMLIKIPIPIVGDNERIRIPKELDQFKEVILTAINFDKVNNPNHEKMYAYITISQSVVKGGRAQRRKGAHVDGLDETTYLKKGLIPDHTYIFSTSIPTHFFDQAFPINNLRYEDTLQYFAREADSAKVVTYQPGVIALMDSYTVHEVGTATEPLQPRTFIKITFSFDRFAMAGNSLNLLFKDEYSNPSSPWVWKLRGKGRNSTSK